MSYSPWKCFFHPRRAGAEIDRLTALCEELNRTVSSCGDELNAMRVTVMTARESEAVCNRRCDGLENDLKAAVAKIADMTRELEDRRVDEEEYNKIVKAIDSFGAVKARYQKKIKALQQDLESARRALLGVSPSGFDIDDSGARELLEPPPARYAPPSPPLKPPAKKEPDEKEIKKNAADWLQQLPENL